MDVVKVKVTRMRAADRERYREEGEETMWSRKCGRKVQPQ